MKLIQSKILCVAAVSLMTMTACQSAAVGDNPKGSTGNSATVATKETAADSDPKTVLVNSMKSLQDEKAWIAEVDTSNDAMPQGDVKMQIKYAAPDNFQIENNASGTKMQIVATGGKTYIQTGGKWQEAPASVNMGQMINGMKDMFSDEKLQAFKNIQYAGKETLDGKELSVYTYEIDQEKAMPDDMKKEMNEEARARIAEAQMENKAKIWIDARRNLPSRMELTMKMAKPQPMTQKMTVDYIYDQEVKIEAPKLK